MKITRNICGQEVEIVLEENEVNAIYEEKHEEFLKDDILEKYTAIHGCEPDQKTLAAMMEEYRNWRADLWVGENGECGAAHEFVVSLSDKYKPKQKPFISPHRRTVTTSPSVVRTTECPTTAWRPATVRRGRGMANSAVRSIIRTEGMRTRCIFMHPRLASSGSTMI